MLNTDKPHIRHLAEICFQKGVNKFVVSPGSRSAPVVLALSRHKGIRVYPIIDERSAAYFAMGMAQQLCMPVGLVCTSGTAAINLAPAVAEAFYQRIPLLVLTADRPPEWIDQSDGQTIRQRALYQPHVLKSFELPTEPDSDDELWYSDRVVNEAINTAIAEQGPVHINIPLREPLARQVAFTQPDTPRIIHFMAHQADAEQIGLPEVAGNKIMWLGGQGCFPVSSDSRFLFLCDITCNITHWSYKNLDALITAIPEAEKEQYRPDLLISFGGGVVSRKMKEFLRAYPPRQHWRLDDRMRHVDTFQCLTHLLPCSAEVLIKSLTGKITASESYLQLWHALYIKTIQYLDKFIQQAPFCDLKAFYHLFHLLNQRQLPIDLQLGNSSPVRYAAYFPLGNHIRVYSNRGVSGIDGTVSTAAGAACASGKLTLLITGDLAFRYDLNGLWNPALPSLLRIIVINNGGGHIFRLIYDENTLPELEDLFEMPHPYSIEYSCKSMNIRYYFCASEKEIIDNFDDFLDPAAPVSVMEIKTDSKTSAGVFEHYLKGLRAS